MKDLIDLS